MKVIFEYNSGTGEIKDSAGVSIFMIGMTPFTSEDKEAQSTDIDGMIKLKNAGFTAEEIIEMKKAGIT